MFKLEHPYWYRTVALFMLTIIVYSKLWRYEIDICEKLFSAASLFKCERMFEESLYESFCRWARPSIPLCTISYRTRFFAWYTVYFPLVGSINNDSWLRRRPLARLLPLSGAHEICLSLSWISPCNALKFRMLLKRHQTIDCWGGN